MATPPRRPITLPERYSVVRHVADGGMASVWEATDELLGRSVAVKVLSPAYAADEAARRRFTREARAAARLSTHPHVVTVYDAGEHEGQAFLVMALYPGGTVAERIKAGPVARLQALDWLEDAAGALDLAHGEGVVHRDVKPANLLLDAGDRVAVADFGIATAAWETSMTSTGLVLGTLAYLAPEQRTGGVATPASDRYALGLVARELLTGARPGTEPTHPLVLPGAAELALERATAEDPAARPRSCQALVEELEVALGDQEATAPTRPAAAPRARAVAVPVAAAGAAAAIEPRVARAATSAPVPAAERTAMRPADPPTGPPPGGAPRSRRGAKALGALGLVALLAGVGLAVGVAGGDDPAPKDRTTTSAEAESTTQERTTSSASTPAPAASTQAEPPATEEPATASTPTPAAPTKSREALAAQNNRSFAATDADPAGQVAPLQEAVDGLCTDESDINCAFALFNLARALRLSDRPAEAVPLLERRLAISDDKVDVVRQELARAQAAAGVAPTPGGGKGNGKAKGKGGADG